ncbi:hypothetical protein Tco_0532621 [Tanacetum coccineum]
MMDAPLFPDHGFDFLTDEPEPKPELVEVPVAMNGWIEEDDQVENLEGDQEEDPDMDIDEDEAEEEEEEESEEDDDQLMAPVTPLRTTVFLGSTYKVGGPSTAAPEPSFPVGRPFSDKGRVEVLVNQHDLMVNKIEEVKDQVLKIHDMVDTHPCEQVLRLSQQVQTLQTALETVESQNQQLQTRLAESESHESTMVSYIL